MRKASIEATVHIQCECGYVGAVRWGYSGLQIIPPYTNESGTSWPMEVHITCPNCKLVDEYPEFV